ncbi:hypothetical protein [Nguyenibacter sp. L1]|uniref:ArnT family glycosyltransferase n=1 Tax=Nguyenibacter sp. L1 TaxID=3049350 RepID=UPI002B477129|nr:hypothetical protein [Nguyenibacter sp. L1]WRH89332.1 hypothetical protein QN315_06945 [Nguyenibacter sp. L1]
MGSEPRTDPIDARHLLNAMMISDIPKISLSLPTRWPRAMRPGGIVGPTGGALALLLAALVLRWPTFGDPMLGWDEEFYLFVGGRMLHGDIPYVDIWDRKPIGLFVIYAFFHLFGPWRVWAYQIGALLCVWLTAMLVTRMARHVAPPAGAFIAGLLYIAWLNQAGGHGGQSSVFYTPLVAAAMACILDRLPRLGSDAALLRRTGVQAMGLLGMAIQIKYTVIGEGVFAGLLLLGQSGLGQSGRDVRTFLKNGSLWVFVALFPTLAVFGLYALAGHGRAWWFANIDSIFLRAAPDPRRYVPELAGTIVVLAPIFLALMLGWLSGAGAMKNPRDMAFLRRWTLAAFASFLLFKARFVHYSLPLFAPLAVAAAPLWFRRSGRIALLLLLGWAILQGERTVWLHFGRVDDAALMNRIVETVSHPAGECVFVYQGPQAVYDRVPWCGLTTHPFMGHLSDIEEAHATGIDVSSELRRILAARPGYILLMQHAPAGRIPESERIVHDALGAGYVAVRYVPAARGLVIFERRDLLSAGASIPRGAMRPAERGAALHENRSAQHDRTE